MRDPTERIAALERFLDEETFADLETLTLHRHAGRVLTLHQAVQDLREAGLASQADALLQRINAQSPQDGPALPGPSQPIHNGTPAVPLPRARRGRPPKTP